MKTNKAMRELLLGCQLAARSLSQPLRAILSEGLIQVDGCTLLKSLAAGVASDSKARMDSTGFECFVNHIHLEDYAAERGCALLEQAFAFVEELRQLAANSGVSEQLVFIIAGDLEDLTVRFHVFRPDQEWLDSDLEHYKEGVAVLTTGGDN
jgi:hypothetical protein